MSSSSTPASLAAFANIVPNRGTMSTLPLSGSASNNSITTTDTAELRPIVGVDGITGVSSKGEETRPDALRGGEATRDQAQGQHDAARSSFTGASSRNQGGVQILAASSVPNGIGAGGSGHTAPHPALGRYGAGDLMPAGTAPLGSGGGMIAGNSNYIVREAFYGAGGHQYAESERPRIGGQVPPGATYLPVAPGDDPRRWNPGRGIGGDGAPLATYGGPDPDHLPPFDPTGLGNRGSGPTFGRGRGGMPSSRGLGGPGSYFC